MHENRRVLIMKFYNVVQSAKIGSVVYGIRAKSESDAIEKVYTKTKIKCLYAFVDVFYGSGMTSRIDLPD